VGSADRRAGDLRARHGVQLFRHGEHAGARLRQIGPAFLILAPVIGFIGVALSGSNTSTNEQFGGFQYSVGGLLHMPSLLLPSLSSVGAEIGKPIAPQTTSVGVSTSKYVRREGQVIRYNLP
jgi:lactate permease